MAIGNHVSFRASGNNAGNRRAALSHRMVRLSRIASVMLCGAAFLIHLYKNRMVLLSETLLYPASRFAFSQGIVEPYWWEYFLAAFLRTYSLAPDVAVALHSLNDLHDRSNALRGAAARP